MKKKTFFSKRPEVGQGLERPAKADRVRRTHTGSSDEDYMPDDDGGDDDDDEDDMPPSKVPKKKPKQDKTPEEEEEQMKQIVEEMKDPTNATNLMRRRAKEYLAMTKDEQKQYLEGLGSGPKKHNFINFVRCMVARRAKERLSPKEKVGSASQAEDGSQGSQASQASTSRNPYLKPSKLSPVKQPKIRGKKLGGRNRRLPTEDDPTKYSRKFKCTYESCKPPQVPVQIAYTRKHDLKRHVLSAHLGYEFRCDICPPHVDGFRDAKNLKAHMDRHLGKLRYQCNYTDPLTGEECDFTAEGRLIINDHQARVHNVVTDEAMRTCDRCGTIYPSQFSMSRHRFNMPDCVKRLRRLCPVAGCETLPYTNQEIFRHIHREHPEIEEEVRRACEEVLYGEEPNQMGGHDSWQAAVQERDRKAKWRKSATAPGDSSSDVTPGVSQVEAQVHMQDEEVEKALEEDEVIPAEDDDHHKRDDNDSKKDDDDDKPGSGAGGAGGVGGKGVDQGPEQGGGPPEAEKQPENSGTTQGSKGGEPQAEAATDTSENPLDVTNVTGPDEVICIHWRYEGSSDIQLGEIKYSELVLSLQTGTLKPDKPGKANEPMVLVAPRPVQETVEEMLKDLELTKNREEQDQDFMALAAEMELPDYVAPEPAVQQHQAEVEVTDVEMVDLDAPGPSTPRTKPKNPLPPRNLQLEKEMSEKQKNLNELLKESELRQKLMQLKEDEALRTYKRRAARSEEERDIRIDLALPRIREELSAKKEQQNEDIKRLQKELAAAKKSRDRTVTKEDYYFMKQYGVDPPGRRRRKRARGGIRASLHIDRRRSRRPLSSETVSSDWDTSSDEDEDIARRWSASSATTLSSSSMTSPSTTTSTTSMTTGASTSSMASSLTSPSQSSLATESSTSVTGPSVTSPSESSPSVTSPSLSSTAETTVLQADPLAALDKVLVDEGVIESEKEGEGDVPEKDEGKKKTGEEEKKKDEKDKKKDEETKKKEEEKKKRDAEQMPPPAKPAPRKKDDGKEKEKKRKDRDDDSAERRHHKKTKEDEEDDGRRGSTGSRIKQVVSSCVPVTGQRGRKKEKRDKEKDKDRESSKDKKE